jgi:hypothetical protein
MGRPRAVLELGDWVAYDGEEFQVAALAGTSIRLRSANGADRVVLAADPEFWPHRAPVSRVVGAAR